jgi:hypothetical protein
MLVETTFNITAVGQLIDVDAWTKQLNIIPGNAVRLGEKCGSSRNARISPDSWWGFGIDKSEAESVEAQLIELLEMLLIRKDAILAIGSGKDVELRITSYAWDLEQSLVADISVETLEKLCELRCSYSVATY